MKTELKELIKENYKNLCEAEIELLVNQMYAVLPTRARKLCDIAVGDKFTYAGYEFTKLADEENSCYCLLNDTVFESKFGETNDWAKSPIRKRLNEFDDKGNSKAIKGIKKNDLVEVSLNYYAYKVPNGRTNDYITLLSWEERYTYDFETVNKDTWLRSGHARNAYNAFFLTSSGSIDNHYVSSSFAVRPALHFRKDLEVEI